MNRFLKKEWDDTEIAERTYLEARNRAWARLQKSRGPWAVVRGPWAAVAALLLVAVLVILAIPKKEMSGVARQTITPIRSVATAEATTDVLRKSARSKRKSAPRAPAGGQPVKASKQPADETPERIVMNFQLPETGVRMIWILDKNFDLNGGTE